jgi:hypothetical protein
MAPICPADAVFNYNAPLLLLLLSILCTGISADYRTNYMAFYECYVCSLCRDAVSSSDYTASSYCLVANNEFEKMWKEVVVTQLKVPYLERLF